MKGIERRVHATRGVREEMVAAGQPRFTHDRRLFMPAHAHPICTVVPRRALVAALSAVAFV